MNIDDQDDFESKEWEEALSLVENIFKEFKENSADSDEPNSVLLDVARWKVVWGKKPAQYRLKPFLMWSVLPSIPEECESSSEAQVAEKVNEIIKIKKDKHVRFLKRKMFKMKRRIDDINILLGKTLSDEAVASLREDDPTILQLGAQRVELINERNIIREKLRKFNKKLMTFKGPAIETNGLSGERQDVGDAPGPTDGLGTNADEHSPSQSDLHDEEPWGFKSCRRSAIRKDGKGTWNKPQPKEMPRSSCDITVDRKCKKKRCCKGHHKRQETKDGEEAGTLERQALSESDLTSGARDRIREMYQLKHFGTDEGLDKSNKYELRTSRSSEHHKELTMERGARGKDRTPSVRCAQDIGSGSRAPRPRRNIGEGTALRHDKEAATSTTSGPQMQGNSLRTGLKKDTRVIRSTTDVGAEDQKQSQEQTKHWRSKRSSSTKEGRAVRTYTRSKPVDKDFAPKSRTWKSLENASRVDQPEVPGKRIPITNAPS